VDNFLVGQILETTPILATAAVETVTMAITATGETVVPATAIVMTEETTATKVVEDAGREEAAILEIQAKDSQVPAGKIAVNCFSPLPDP
jgi:hypothetical protein